MKVCNQATKKAKPVNHHKFGAHPKVSPKTASPHSEAAQVLLHHIMFPTFSQIQERMQGRAKVRENKRRNHHEVRAPHKVGTKA